MKSAKVHDLKEVIMQTVNGGQFGAAVAGKATRMICAGPIAIIGDHTKLP